jgi:hypothetical protein
VVAAAAVVETPDGFEVCATLCRAEASLHLSMLKLPLLVLTTCTALFALHWRAALQAVVFVPLPHDQVLLVESVTRLFATNVPTLQVGAVAPQIGAGVLSTSALKLTVTVQSPLRGPALK